MGDSSLHRLGTLQHERQLHLASSEQLANDLHAAEQHVVDDFERCVLLARLVEVLVDVDLIAVDDALLESFLDRQEHLILTATHFDALGTSEPFDELEQRVVVLGATIVDQVECDLFVFLIELVRRNDLAGVHDRRVEAVLDRFGHVDRIEDLARVRIETEADVAKAEDRAHAGHVLFDQLDALERLLTGIARCFVT